MAGSSADLGAYSSLKRTGLNVTKATTFSRMDDYPERVGSRSHGKSSQFQRPATLQSYWIQVK